MLNMYGEKHQSLITYQLHLIIDDGKYNQQHNRTILSIAQINSVAITPAATQNETPKLMLKKTEYV